ncbi:hypothetical protein [Bradyrhizobium sp. STM 3809]|uniref:hypothetical protein n=1 Tax=Bradyrhizobium sp. STM 3809 TaxID=551936 RepID=UPI0002407CD4|nr:hypothetical protein [Bradyrhizobium sp. STM 3809]CCE02639.1 hypothetical protein BRAS3809_6350013 [Bradyrhizobium sp. STM 3809]
MSVIVMSASARHRLLSRTETTHPALAIDEDTVCRQARWLRRRIAVSGLALAGEAQESVLHLMT